MKFQAWSLLLGHLHCIHPSHLSSTSEGRSNLLTRLVLFHLMIRRRLSTHSLLIFSFGKTLQKSTHTFPTKENHHMLTLKILAFSTSKNTSSDQLFHSRIFELMVEIRLRFAFQIWGRPHWLGDLLQRFWNAVDSVKCETETFWDRSFSSKQTCVVKMKRKMRLKFWAQLDLLLLKVDKTYFFFFFFFFF